MTFRFLNWGLEFYDVASTVHVGYGDTPAIRSRINPHIQSTSSILGGTVREITVVVMIFDMNCVSGP